MSTSPLDNGPLDNGPLDNGPSDNGPSDDAMRDGLPERGASNGASMNGMRPMVAASCRSALRASSSDAAARQHLDQCAFCTARVHARAALAEFVSIRPQMPAALSSRVILEGIYERATDQAEHGAVGAWLDEAAVPLLQDQLPQDQREEPQSERDPSGQPVWREVLADRVLSNDVVSNQVLANLVRQPVQPNPEVWPQVCRSILEGVASERVLRRRNRKPLAFGPKNWSVLLAGAAAAAVIGLIAQTDQAPVQPNIVMVDLDRAPDVPFANVRYGSRH